MKRHVISGVACAIVAGILCAGTGGDEAHERGTKLLLSPAMAEREASLAKLAADYRDAEKGLLEALREGTAKHKGDRSYDSPLHCAILAVENWHVLRADDELLLIVGYELDVATFPVGLNVMGQEFFPAADALVRLRVDTWKVVNAIGACPDVRGLRLLTWVLVNRTSSLEEARFLVEAAKKGKGAKEQENLTKAAGLLDLKPGEHLELPAFRDAR